jgi:hypothetical protein
MEDDPVAKYYNDPETSSGEARLEQPNGTKGTTGERPLDCIVCKYKPSICIR